MRVLLVEDDPMIGEAVSTALKDATYAADWVLDGESAIATLASAAHQAVLLDLGLPKQSGMDVLKRLRQQGNAVPVIIVSARDAVEDRIKALDLGADDYVLKPFDVHELLARLRAVIRRHNGQAAPVLSNGTISLDPVTREARRGDAAYV
ncbi:MAG: response regulator, partial [Burkholderiales bacterium]